MKLYNRKLCLTGAASEHGGEDEDVAEALGEAGETGDDAQASHCAAAQRRTVHL